MSGINEKVYIKLDVEYEGEDFYLLVIVNPDRPTGYTTKRCHRFNSALACFKALAESGIEVYAYEVCRTWEDGEIEQTDLTDCFYALMGA